MEEFEPYVSYALALFAGLLIGLEREHSNAPSGRAHFIGGIRTFPIFALAGAVSSSLARSLGPWPFIAAAVAMLAFTIAGRKDEPSDEPQGITSEGAFLLTFLLGVLAGTTDVFRHTTQKIFAVASVTVVTTMLLSAKSYLHTVTQKISRDDVIATVKFLLIAVVVLPLLPNEPLGPYGVLNPWKIGLNVVLIAGVSFVGYAASRILGPGRGLLITGVVGGLASSTAVTLAASRHTRQTPTLADASALSITAASSVKALRVLVLVAAAGREVLPRLLAPFIAMAVAGALCSVVLYVRSRKEAAKGNEPALKNPFELSESLKFGAAIIGVMLVSRWAQDQFGDVALYVTSLTAGLADVDAITLSVAGMAQRNEIAAQVAVIAVFIAVLANTLTKQGITMAIGTRGLSARVGLTSALMLAAGGAAIAVQSIV